MSVPSNQIPGLKIFAIFIDDFWLYAYDKRNYTGLPQLAFRMIAQIEQVKWTFFNYASSFNLTHLNLPISNYTAFSNPKHYQVDQIDDHMVKNLFKFLVFTIPQTFVFISVCFRLFMYCINYRFSVYLRRFCFGCCFLQIIFENNIAYFTYIFVNQTKILFAFNFTDKVFLAISVMIFFVVFLFGICFFFLLSS